MTEQIDSFQISCIFIYFFEYHFLLKQYFQKEHFVESAWWSPLQLEHLNECRYGSPFLVSNLERLVFLLALQHYTNSLWWIV